MEVTVRAAALSDEARLLGWRNAPEVRAASFTSGVIDPGGHARWFRDALSDPDREVWIAMAGDLPLGVVRLSREGEAAEVHILLGDEGRGRGLSAPALQAALDASAFRPGVWRARVKRSNDASMALFRRAGFHETGPDDPAVFERTA